MELASNFCFSVLFFLDDVKVSVVVIILEDHIVSSLEARHKILSPFSRQEKKTMACVKCHNYHVLLFKDTILDGVNKDSQYIIVCNKKITKFYLSFYAKRWKVLW